MTKISRGDISKINLIIWAGSAVISGVDIWIAELKRNLKDSSYNVIVLSDGELFAGEERVDIIISSWNQLEKVLKKLSPALVMPNWRYPTFGICAKLRKEGYKLRCLGICHSDNIEEYYRPLTWYESAISKFITVSPKCKEALIKYLPERKFDIFHLPYGLRIPKEFNKQYSIKPLKLVYFGRVQQEQKRVYDFVKLVEILNKKNIDYDFDIIGSGIDRRNLIKKIAKCRCNKRVKFINQIPHSEVIKRLKEYDVFLQLSNYEGLSISMLEAMAAKIIPCVTKASGESSNVIGNGRNGFYVDVGDVEGMACVLKEISMMKKEEVARIGKLAYETVKNNFDIEETMPKYIEIFDLCMRGQDRQWAHRQMYIMPGGWSSRYLPKNELLGLILRGIFKIIPRAKIRSILSQLKLYQPS